jgi:hypothetical protein
MAATLWVFATVLSEGYSAPFRAAVLRRGGGVVDLVQKGTANRRRATLATGQGERADADNPSPGPDNEVTRGTRLRSADIFHRSLPTGHPPSRKARQDRHQGPEQRCHRQDSASQPRLRSNRLITSNIAPQGRRAASSQGYLRVSKSHGICSAHHSSESRNLRPETHSPSSALVSKGRSRESALVLTGAAPLTARGCVSQIGIHLSHGTRCFRPARRRGATGAEHARGFRYDSLRSHQEVNPRCRFGVATQGSTSGRSSGTRSRR